MSSSDGPSWTIYVACGVIGFSVGIVMTVLGMDYISPCFPPR